MWSRELMCFSVFANYEYKGLICTFPQGIVYLIGFGDKLVFLQVNYLHLVSMQALNSCMPGIS